MAAPTDRLQTLEKIEAEIGNVLHTAASVLQELAKDKASIKQVETHSSMFLKQLNGVETELTRQINYLTQVSTGQPHEGSSYASAKVLQMARHRLQHARNEAAKLDAKRGHAAAAAAAQGRPPLQGPPPPYQAPAGQQAMMQQQAGQQPMMTQQAGQQPMMPQQAGQQPMMQPQAGQQPMMPQQAGQQPMMQPQAGQQPLMPQQAMVGPGQQPPPGYGQQPGGP